MGDPYAVTLVIETSGRTAAPAHPPLPPETTAALLDLARSAAVDASELLASRHGQWPPGVATKSSSTDMVSDVDRASETLITARILAARPDDGVLGEEDGERLGTSGIRWVVDPLDGTTNYLYGHRAYAVSIAAEYHGEVVVGVVADPGRGEIFAASRGSGAFVAPLGGCGVAAINTVSLGAASPGAALPGRSSLGRPIRASTLAQLDQALVATGFSYSSSVRAEQARMLPRLLPRVRDIRRLGAAALDLCWVACGRFDVYYETDLAAWDVAAGVLIATEAGAVSVELPSQRPGGRSLVAGSPALVDPLLDLLSAPQKKSWTDEGAQDVPGWPGPPEVARN
ncbi:MAG: inositol monophosphatase family protein [Acidimicrobiales bacterium]